MKRIVTSPPVFLYRISHFFYKRKIVIISKIINYINRLIFSVWIPGSAQIGKNFRLGYCGLGIVIVDHAVIGDNCLVAQNVTIGRNFGNKGVPVIGNDVYVGTGSVVFGNITVGSNVIIGSNSVVNKSIEDNVTIVGNPFRIIKSNRMIKYYEMD